MKRACLAALLMLTGLAYPFVIHVAWQQGAGRWLLLALAALWLLRALWTQPGQPGGRMLPIVALGFCAVAALGTRPSMLLWYPVLINLAFCAVFGLSLRTGVPVVEKLARLREPDLPPAGVRYTRRVTQVWTAFFAMNALCAAAITLFAPLTWWTAYNGAISYVLMGLLFAVEWAVRPYARRRGAAS